MTQSTSKLSHLELVVPPMSSQEAFQLKDDSEAERQMRASDFYLIAGKPAYRFHLADGAFDEATGVLSLSIMLGDHEVDRGTINLIALPFIVDRGIGDFRLQCCPELVAIVDGDSVPAAERLVNSFTPEGLLWSRSRFVPGIAGFDRYEDLSTYDLLYAGIAKKGDSFDRLIAKGHEARMNILSNARQRATGSRVADEIFLFLFRVQPLFIQTYTPDHAFDESDKDISEFANNKSIVADAEKAFVSLLRPHYNRVVFKQYPRGADGLSQIGFVRYGYTLGEALTFHTPMGRFRGGRHPIAGPITNRADLIFVEGDSVELSRSGIDFPEIDP